MAYYKYMDLLGQLRRVRQEQPDKQLRDTAEESINDELDQLWEEMCTHEQELTRKEMWRAWPDLYESRMERSRGVPVWSRLRDLPVWGGKNSKPRERW